MLADTIECFDARCRKVCAGSHQHVLHLTDTSLRLGSAQGNKIASNVRQDFAKAAKEAIMSSFYWTEQEGKAKSWGAAPLLPPTERSRDLFLDSARAKRFLQGA